MSTFIVSNKLIQRSVSALREPEMTNEEYSQLGRDLFYLNYDAFNCRYAEKGGPLLREVGWDWKVCKVAVDQYQIPMERMTTIGWLKALHCLRYQLSEGGVPKHELYGRLERRIRAMETAIVISLKEYKDADWN